MNTEIDSINVKGKKEKRIIKIKHNFQKEDINENRQRTFQIIFILP